MPPRNLIKLPILPRIHNLSHITTYPSTHPRSDAIKPPTQRKLEHHVHVRTHAELGQSIEGEAVVARAAEGEEDVGGFAEAKEGGGCGAAFVEFFVEAGAVPFWGGLAGKFEEAVPFCRDLLSSSAHHEVDVLRSSL
jgi:hypothetical protein